MNEYKVVLRSEKSWLELNKPNILTYNVWDFDETKARIQAVKLNEKKFGENDYCVVEVVKL